MPVQEFAMKTVRVVFDETSCARNVPGLGNRCRVVVIQQAQQFLAMHVCAGFPVRCRMGC